MWLLPQVWFNHLVILNFGQHGLLFVSFHVPVLKSYSDLRHQDALQDERAKGGSTCGTWTPPGDLCLTENRPPRLRLSRCLPSRPVAMETNTNNTDERDDNLLLFFPTDNVYFSHICVFYVDLLEQIQLYKKNYFGHFMHLWFNALVANAQFRPSRTGCFSKMTSFATRPEHQTTRTSRM